MNAILSVKPEFAFKLLSGEKRYEYRKTVFRLPVDKVYIYASSPICMIVGEFRIDDVIESTPTELWAATRSASGVTSSFFFRYFNGKSKAYAIKVKDVVSYAIPLSPYTVQEDFKAPQNYIYVK